MGLFGKKKEVEAVYERQFEGGMPVASPVPLDQQPQPSAPPYQPPTPSQKDNSYQQQLQYAMQQSQVQQQQPQPMMMMMPPQQQQQQMMMVPPQQQMMQQQQQPQMMPQLRSNGGIGLQKPGTPYLVPNTITGNSQVDNGLHAIHDEAFGKRSCLHRVFMMFSFLTGLTSLNNIIAHCIALLFRNNPPLEVALRWYIIAFHLLVIVNEADRTPFLLQSPIIHHWLPRGLFYSFLGVLGLSQYDIGSDNYGRYGRNHYNWNNRRRYNRNNYNGYNSGSGVNVNIYIPSKEDTAEFYIWMVSCVMILMGSIYIIMGAMCLQQKLYSLRTAYKESKNKNQQGGEGAAGVTTVPNNTNNA